MSFLSPEAENPIIIATFSNKMEFAGNEELGIKQIYFPQHRLYFLPLPQLQGLLRPVLPEILLKFL